MTQFILLLLWIAWDGESGSVVSGFPTQTECDIAKTLIGNPPDRFDIHYYHKECIEVQFSETGEDIALARVLSF